MLQLTGTSSSSETALPDGSVLITERIRGEFREMPGLTLTVAQAKRASINAFGLEIDNAGKNGHYAPISWAA